MLEILLIAVSLSMDAFAVSVSSAACSKDIQRYHMIRAAGAFGLFQFIMPLAGWFLGTTFSNFLSAFDHWIAFGLLAFVGGKMLVEVFEEWIKTPASCECSPDEKKKLDITSKRIVLILALATSIDALAVGMSFAVIGTQAFFPSLIIGFVTFIICLAGFFFGKRISCMLGRYAQLAGGFILVGIGTKILLSHILGGF